MKPNVDIIGFVIIELEAQAKWFDENGDSWAASCLRERVEELSKK